MTGTDARMAALEAVAEAARDCTNALFGGGGRTVLYGALLNTIAALDALPPAQPAGETVEVRAAVFSNGGDGWTVYGSSHVSDQTVIATATDDLSVHDNDESHIGWINATLTIPKRTLPEWPATVEPTP